MKRIIYGLAGALCVAAIILFVPAENIAKYVLDESQSLGFWGYAVFVLVYMAFTVLFVPGFILTVGAGAAFGLLPGFIAVSVGSTLGAAAAFVIGRFFARGWVAGKIVGKPRFAAIDKAVGKQGTRIVFLTRLSPVFPFNLLNYAYGLTKIPLGKYTLASWVGMMPGTLLYVYVGALAGTVAKAATHTPEATTFETTMKVVGFAATLAVTVYLTKIARSALEKETELDA